MHSDQKSTPARPTTLQLDLLDELADNAHLEMWPLKRRRGYAYILMTRRGAPNWQPYPNEYRFPLNTILACQRRGWLDGIQITEAGRKLAREMRPKHG